MKETIQSGHPDADQMSAFVEHVLPAHERNEMLAHLAVCPECRATVAMLQPETEPLWEPGAETKHTPWFIGWRFLWPAAAAATALAAFVLYVDRRPNGQQKHEPRQVAVLRAPEASRLVEPTEDSMTTRTAGPAVAKADVKQKTAKPETNRKKTAVLPSATFAVSAAQPPDSREQPIAGLAVPLAMTPPTMQSLATVPQLPVGGSQSMKSASAVAMLRLPTGQSVLSMATQGAWVLAVDARNAVFFSQDGGAHWSAVPIRWKGRAVKADLVHYEAATNPIAPTLSIGGATQFAPANRPLQQPRRAANVQTQTENQNLILSQPEGKDASKQAQLDSVLAQNQEQNAPLTLHNGRLHGTVTNMSGAVVPDAKVSVTEFATQATQTTTSNQDGTYILDQLAPGSYEMKTEAQGFEQQTQEGVDVKTGQSNVANIALRVGAETQTVTVEARNSAEMETESMTLAEPTMHSAKSAPASLIFEITTDTGDHWVSSNGMTWRLK